MKYSYLTILFISLACLTNCASKTHILVNKKYIARTEYDIMELHFLDKEKCMFTQTFTICNDIDVKYRAISILCQYKLKGNIIRLRNIYPIDSIGNKAFIKIPYEELSKCDYMGEYTIDEVGRKYDKKHLKEIEAGKSLIIDMPRFYNNGYYVGWLNYIQNETMLYQDSLIMYSKGSVRRASKINGLVGLDQDEHRGITKVFEREGHPIDSLIKQRLLLDLVIKNKMPFNTIEE